MQDLPTRRLKKQKTNGNVVPVTKHLVQLLAASELSSGNFIGLPTTVCNLEGMSILKNFAVAIKITDHLVHFLDLFQQLKRAHVNLNCVMCSLGTAQKLVSPIFFQLMILVCTKIEIDMSQRTFEPTPFST